MHRENIGIYLMISVISVVDHDVFRSVRRTSLPMRRSIWPPGRFAPRESSESATNPATGPSQRLAGFSLNEADGLRKAGLLEQ